MRAQEFISEISDEKLQDYLSRAGRRVDSRLERMARARDRLNKGYEIYHAENPTRIVHRFEANTPAEAKRYYERYNAKYDSDVDYDLRLRRATGIMEGRYNANPATYNLPRRPLNVPELIKRGAIFITDPHGPDGWETDAEGFSLVTLYNVERGGWPAEAKQHLKPSMYKVAAKALNQQGSGTMMYDGKYNQILWSIKKLGIPDEVAFLDTIKESTSNTMSTADMIAYLRQHHDTNLHQDYLDHVNTNSKFILKDIPLSSISLGLSGLDRAKVEKYKKQDTTKAPPIVVGSDGYILDGYHRATAVKELGIPTIRAYVGVKEVEENAVSNLEKNLKNPHSYDAIDHMMQSIAKKHGITGKELHDRFVKKHGQVPDDWIKDRVTENVPQPGSSSGAPTQFAPGTQIQNQQMTAQQIISSIPGVPYYNNVVDDWDAKDFSWGVTKKVIEYAEYLKQHPESLSKLPPIQVVNGKFKDGAHRVSAVWLLQQRMDPQNPLWKNAKLNVQFAQQNVEENFADGKVKGKSRPGRVKRSGASCKGSVTDLRAKAKKYSGERGKMYHWCANMKSGRKK